MLFKRFSDRFFDKWFWSIDFKIIIIVLTLLLIGVVLDLSASPYIAIRLNADPLYFFVRHIIYVFLSIILIFFISFLNEKQIKQLALFIFIISFLAILATLVFNIEVKGAKRWIHMFGFSIQPSEFVKVCFPLVLANIWEKLSKKDKLSAYLLMTIIYVTVVLSLIMQPDLGMTIIVSITFAIILFITEVRIVWIFILAVLGLVLLIISYFAFMHVQYRVDNFFSGERSYQISKAIEAIKNGGFLGVGAGEGVIKEYLPDAHTDFIFAVAVEEYGIIFAILLIILYGYLFFRIYKLLKFETRIFNYISVVSFLSILFIQTFIHMSTNINLTPAKGVTLPFISYGGTSLISSALLIGFIIVLTKKNVN